MRFDVSHDEIKKANIPHELFLTNLVGNHILMTVAAGGIAGSFPWVMAIIPTVSFAILAFTLWRARRSRQRDPWYVMCHWQICERRSWIFLTMLALLLVVAGLGWLGYAYGGMMKEAAFALVAGIGILPVMVTILVLVMVESDALYHANQAKLPDWVFARYPNPDAKVIHDPEPTHDTHH
jgi:hypothetical protein